MTLGYSVNVPFVVENISVSLNYSRVESVRPSVNGTIITNQLMFPDRYLNETDTLRYRDNLTQLQPFFTTFPLGVGLNVLYVNSSEDGLIEISITRDAPDVRDLQIFGYNNVSLWQTDFTANFTPSFSGGWFRYTLVLPYIVNGLSLTPFYDTADTLTIDQELMATGPNISSGQATAVLPLVQGMNQFHLCSLLDGNYTVFGQDTTRHTHTQQEKLRE